MTPSKRGGRKQIDWPSARTYYLELGPGRSLAMVSRQFGVSDTSVGKHAKQSGWKEAGLAFDQEVERRQEQAALRTRTNRKIRVLTAADDFIDGFADNAKAKGGDGNASDFAAVVKLTELLEGEPTDRVQVGEVQQMFAVILSGVSVFIAADKRGDFLAWLEEVKPQLTIESAAA
jgi:hypothetical protein